MSSPVTETVHIPPPDSHHAHTLPLFSASPGSWFHPELVSQVRISKEPSSSPPSRAPAILLARSGESLPHIPLAWLPCLGFALTLPPLPCTLTTASPPPPAPPPLLPTSPGRLLQHLLTMAYL